jgi:xylan 1,4-beta-xylosidase
LKLRVKSSGGRKLQFSYVNGASGAPMMLNKEPVDGGYLPPWDRAVRVGLVVIGKGVGEFEGMEIVNSEYWTSDH